MCKCQADIREVAACKDAVAFENALGECFRSGQLHGICDVLIDVLPEDWHFRHEDVVRAVQDLRCLNAIRALEHRAENCPEYLDWDDNFALARKCTWALADIGTNEARDALLRLAHSDTPEIRGFAQRRLDRWDLEADRKTRKT